MVRLARLTLRLQRIVVIIGFADVDDAVDVEGNLLAVGAPMLVAKAVRVLSVHASYHRVVAV